MDKTQVPATQGVGEVIQCGKYPHPWEDSFRRKATASLLNASTGKVRDFIIPGNKDAVCLKKADAMTTDNEQKSLPLITYVMESNLYTFEREKMMQSLDKDLVAPSTPSYPVLSLGGHGVQPFGFNGLERVPGKDSRHLFIQAPVADHQRPHLVLPFFPFIASASLPRRQGAADTVSWRPYQCQPQAVSAFRGQKTSPLFLRRSPGDPSLCCRVWR
ncbi:hypothetical protein [Kushneria phosphatilytica]|uniref:Uncharacterized protein n=1 Tax=Kushneria phosphatilytica TaxID=657387 RepID=A0A1S1NL86_9GAMM|nr:hypothetical protein [Kushneria phosphatilytica]OHV07511.1 hypothetical protein BH688_14865 [Kushneria phosphatilytica]QEL09993.1 hypothetical protein FY550_01820 [Kushneria phosphatilytica]